MSLQDRCNESFPKNDEVRCRQPKNHEGNHIAEGEIVSKKDTWDKVRWEWNKDRIVSSPS